MSDRLREQFRSDEQGQSTETQSREPAPVRAYLHQVRSLLGKRRAEEDNSTLPTQIATMPISEDRMAINTTIYVPKTQLPTTSNAEDLISFDDTSLVDPVDEGGFARYSQESGSSSGTSGFAWLAQDGLMGHDVLSVDGPAERSKRWKQEQPIAAIFIHAGAGYHSTANENIHLQACSLAAMESMKLLKGGGSAVEAVEAAIRVLEDREITNAGYGSNLAMDGSVECDATLVDHFGRSGACGAVPNVKNPITLARVVLEHSNKPLSLRRVPPNLLVGEGAREFGRGMGVVLVSNGALISKNAGDRFQRWRDDLLRAEYKEATNTPASRGETPPQNDQEARKEHAKAILTGTWNEGQPDSPANSSPWQTPQDARSPAVLASPQPSPKLAIERSPLSFLGSSLSTKRQRFFRNKSDECMNECACGQSTTPEQSVNKGLPTRQPYLAPHDGANDEKDPMMNKSPETHPAWRSPYPTVDEFQRKTRPEDRINDTVGAIAIDQSGNIAAGSSSGGIGMKHRGRVGPAALVGVGTAVVPVDADDPYGITVAAVTSGTGEHMATTMASQRCAERIYQGNIRGHGGKDVPEDDENVILESFITRDFLGHPSVKSSSSTGAIGVMTVKKTPGGYYLYFAHNTESFALASMGSNDIGPATVMSRLNDGGSPIATGARKISI